MELITYHEGLFIAKGKVNIERQWSDIEEENIVESVQIDKLKDEKSINVWASISGNRDIKGTDNIRFEIDKILKNSKIIDAIKYTKTDDSVVLSVTKNSLKEIEIELAVKTYGKGEDRLYIPPFVDKVNSMVSFYARGKISIEGEHVKDIGEILEMFCGKEVDLSKLNVSNETKGLYNIFGNKAYGKMEKTRVIRVKTGEEYFNIWDKVFNTNSGKNIIVIDGDIHKNDIDLVMSRISTLSGIKLVVILER